MRSASRVAVVTSSASEADATNSPAVSMSVLLKMITDSFAALKINLQSQTVEVKKIKLIFDNFEMFQNERISF